MSRSPLERENQTLRSEISRINADHRRTVNAKNKEIDRLASMTPAGLKTLFAQYENLENLLALLVRVADLADPLTSVSYDQAKVTTPDNIGTQPMEGQGTRRDRERLAWAGRELSKLARRIELSIRPHQDHPEGLTGGPQCWRRQCEGRGRKQSWDNDVCQWCGEPFSTYASTVREVAGG